MSLLDDLNPAQRMRRVMKTERVSEQELAARTVVGQISRAKNAMIDTDQFERDAAGNPRRLQIARLYLLATSMC